MTPTAKSSGASKRKATPKVSARPRVEIPASLTVKQLSQLMGASGIDVIKQLRRNGIMANIAEGYKVFCNIGALFSMWLYVVKL